MPPGALLQEWPSLESIVAVLAIFILFPPVAGAVGGALAFARAKERLRQRLVIGAVAGLLTPFLIAWRGGHPTITAIICWCIFGGYAAADGISILLKAISGE